MTPDERQLITGLFDRLRQTGLPEKDRDAEQLINGQLRQTPDSGYMLVQSVIVQEMTLEQLQARVEELEDQVRQLERARPQQSSGSFLGGLFGGGSSAQRSATGSVPATSRQSSGFGQGSRAPGQPASPWGNQGQAAPAQQPAGGGFMRSAMATAAGVAGGMLAANAISNMISGGGSAHASPLPASGGSIGSNADAGYGSQSEDMADENNDPGSFSSYGGGDDGGGGWGGGGGDE